MLLAPQDLHALTGATHRHPHSVLGMHPSKNGTLSGVTVRAMLRDAKRVWVVDARTESGSSSPLTRLHESGLYEAFLPGREVFGYRLRIERYNGEFREIHDPYCFLPTLSEDDLYRFNEGTEERLHEKMGARLMSFGEVSGTAFTVWAPSARRVSVVGDYNGWDGRYHPMRPLGASGVWEIFIPGVEAGAKYKFELVGPVDDTPFLKTDPYGAAFESPPHNAAIVSDLSGYAWKDDAWIARRATKNPVREPISVYEMHLGSWRTVAEDGNRPLSYAELGAQLAAYCVEMGFTHVELMPPAEHPFAGSWGYQVTGFYAPTHRYGTPKDFMAFVDTLHGAGIGVIVDWVPAHFPRDAFALAGFDGSHLYDHSDPRQGAHTEWGTLIFNYGRHEVRGFLTGSVLSWIERYHIDGFRVDAVSSMLHLNYARPDGEWVANKDGGNINLEAVEFLRRTNDAVHRLHPGVIMIAEEATSYPKVSHPVSEGGLGFDFKWNMGWMHDSLDYMKKDPIYRQYHHDKLTFGMMYHWSESFMLAYSHDEVVHGKSSLINKMPSWNMRDKAANLRALYALMWTWPGKKTLFMGGEFGQTAEWAYDRSLDWHLLQFKDHSGIRDVVRDLNRLYLKDAGLAAIEQRHEGFEWINADDRGASVLSFLRRDAEAKTWWLVIANFTPVCRDYRVGAPVGGFWEEVINTDAEEYGGSGRGNLGGMQAEAVPNHGRPFSLPLNLPGLTVLVFRNETR